MDGDRDYLDAIRLPMSGSAAFVINFKNQCPLCIFRHSADANFHVYYDESTIAILTEIYADKGYELESRCPDVAHYLTEKAPVILGSFGGKIVVFDAALPGDAIHLMDTGCERVQPDVDVVAGRDSAAVVSVDFGTWEALELYCRVPEVSYTGVLFRRRGG